MNHIYRIVWNQTKACWQAVCETANGHPRGTSSRRASGTSRNAASVRPRTQLKLSHAALLCGFGLMTATVSAAPTGGQVSAGTATISQSGATTTIQQASQKAAIDWTGFSVGKTESVRFNQPNASAITLNRVTGTERSEILGSLSANGQVFILNPNGVLFGKGAQVNVGGIVASTLRMSNEDFMAGNFRLTEGPNARASVSNEGEIRVAEGGVLAMIAPVVTNTGTLAAPQGSVLMAAADAVSVTLQDGSLVSYTLDKGNLQALVDNGGVIHAEGGHVVLTAKGLDALSKAVVNHSGVIEAQTVSTKNGVVELLGDMEVGQVNLSGRVDASAPSGGNGGFVETSAAKVTLSDEARISTVSALGKVGKWLLDPTDLTIAPSGGDLTGKAVSTQLASNDVVLQSAMGTTTGNGDIFVNDRISWSSGTSLSLLAGRNIQINAEINASGNGAGVALSGGQYVLGAGGRITLSGANPEFAVNGENYRVIQTLAQLQAINDDLLGRYVLGTDINASATSTWNGGKGFQPIGQGASNFMGVLDGLGHQVSGLYINRPTEYEVGLIGSMEATVRNIGVESANVTGFDQVGVLAGQIRWGSSVSNSYATGSVKGRGNVGGLIGFATPYHVGGRYWCSMCISVDQSYADVNVVGENAGGLVATTDQTYIRNSYAVGDVTGVDYIGGLIGHNFSSVIANSYAAGTVRGQSARVGGLVGSNGGSISNGHFDSQTSGQSGGNTTAEMKQQATFSGWDFNGVWRIVEGSSYPILRALTKDKITLTVSAANETKVYNAQPWNPNPSDYISYAGFAGGDDSGSLSGVLRLEGAAIGAVDAGTYGYSGAGLSSQKYEISYLPGYLTITPSPISVSGARPYDASNKAYAESVTSLNGVFDRDKGLVSVTSGSGVLSGENVGEWALSSLDTLTLGGKAAGNYRLVASGGKWAISPRPLIIVPFDATKTYGDPDPKLSYVIAGGGLLGNDILAGELGRAPGENAGSYAINKGSLVAGSNYSIQINEPLSHLLINQRPVSLIGERVFDGTDKAYSKDLIRLSGLLDEGVALAAGGYGYLDAAEVGNRALVSVGGLSLEGGLAGNYFLTTVGSQWSVKHVLQVDCAMASSCLSERSLVKHSFVTPIYNSNLLVDGSQNIGAVLLGEGTTTHSGLLADSFRENPEEGYLFLKTYFMDPLVGEVAAGSAAEIYGKIVHFFQASKFLSKTSLASFVASSTAKDEIKAALLKEAKKGVVLKDVPAGILVSLVANAMKVGVKDWLEISEKEEFFDAAMSWEVDQFFVLAQAAVTGGTPVSLLIAEFIQTYEYVDELIEISKLSSDFNEKHISNVASILNGSASLLNKMAHLDGFEDTDEFVVLRNHVLGNIDYLNNDLLPVIKFSYFDMAFGTSVVSGEKISKITKDLLLAKFYKLNGNSGKAAEYVRKVQDYAYLHKDGLGAGHINKAVRQLIAEMGLSQESVQIGPPSS